MKDIYKLRRQTKQIFLFTLMSIVFSFVVLASVTISYFSNQRRADGSIVLGELDFCLYENQALMQNITPGDAVDKQITLVNSRNSEGTDTSGLCSIYIRFSVQTGAQTNLIRPRFLNEDDWTVLDDTYYFNSAITPGQSVNLCSALEFSENAGNEYQGTTLDVTFNVNAIQTENGAYLELWQDAPPSWKSRIAEG